MIDRILDEQIRSIRGRDYHCHLVHWRGRLESKDSWITRENLQKNDADHFEYYRTVLKSDSMESSSPHPGRIDEDITQH